MADLLQNDEVLRLLAMNKDGLTDRGAAAVVELVRPCM